MGLSFKRQCEIPVEYNGIVVSCAYGADFIVEDLVVVELKSIARFDPIHSAQMLTYLKLSKCKIGLLINFNVRILPDGVKRFAL